MFIVYYKMEESVTLYHGNFSILVEWAREFAQRTGCSNCVANWILQSQLFSMSYEENIQTGVPPRNKNGVPVPFGVYAPQCSYHAEKTASKVLLRIAIWDSQVSPWTPLCVESLRIPWFRNPKGCRTSLQGGAQSSTQCTSPQTTKWVNEGAVPRIHQVYDKSWTTKQNWDS